MGGERGGLATLVAARRRALGLTTQALATRAGVARYTLRAIEEGRTVLPHPATLAALADALDLPLAALEATLPPTRVVGVSPVPAATSWRRGCLGCGCARGEARQALLARLGARGSLWLCHDCAQSDASVAELAAAYRRAMPR